MKDLPVRISGITVRNLKNISIEFLPGEIILLTGVSGSGKSSLAFDTIYAAGRKNYVSTLPSFFATTMTKLPDPAIETFIGLSPTIAVKQQPYSHHVHATVGSFTELSQHLALLFSLDGEARDPRTNKVLNLQSKEKILTIIENIPDNTQITLLAPLKDTSLTSIQECIRQGYTKVCVHNTIVPIYSFLSQPFNDQTPVAVVVDTLIKNENNQARLKVSVLSALSLGEGQCFLTTPDYEETFSTQIYIPESQKTYTPLTPQSFSPHSLQGRCLSCQGTGILITIDDPSLIQQNISIRENCCALSGNCSTYFYSCLYQSLADALHFSLDTPWKDLPHEIQQAFLYGQGHLVLPVRLFDSSLGKKVLSHKLWKGILNDIGDKVRYSMKTKEHLPQGTSAHPCPTCQGSGITEYACAATWKGKTFVEFQTMSLSDLASFFSSIQSASPAISEVLDGLKNRLSLLIDLGLPYLTLDRALSTLSGGEQERTVLAKHLGAELSGITYILDEPSIGLHPQDTHKLIHIIQKLRHQGNTVLLVEHDEKMISFVDRIIDIGPGAGIFGGEVMFNGSPKDFLQSCSSLTAQYLRQELNIEIPKRRPPSPAQLSLGHATTHNLKDVTISLPLGRITAVTGVSGSGKSSLINDTLVPAIENSIKGHPIPELKISGGKIERLVHSTRDLPGRSQRSIPLTYIKAFDELRDLFAQQTKSKRLGLTKGHFSFNLSLGSCTECQGLGSIAVSEDLVPLPCGFCQGKRFQPQILEVQYQGKNIADILEMTAYEAEQFFKTTPRIHEKVHVLCSLGLDHLPLGRPLSSLSGGEMQRLKLASELLSPKQPTLYILDEPTTGLHTHDIRSLIPVLFSLTHQGHTVIIIEHNMHMVKIADHVIELGPEGGERGGYLLAACSPEELILLNTPTAKALKPYIENHQPHGEDLHTVPLPSFPKEIIVRDAYHHNLKHIDVSFPRYAFTVVSGPSASGKHSLVFDILHASGNITYAELFPTYIREALIRQTPSPQVHSVRGLSPVVAIKKTGIRKNSRHSLASSLGITKNLEKLFALLGKPHSPVTGEPLIKITPQSIVDDLLLHHLNSYVTITAPLPQDEDIATALKTKQKEGFLKVFANNTYYDLEDTLPQELKDPAIVIQHIKITKTNESSLLSSLTLGFSLSPTIRLHIHHSLETIETLSYALGWQDHQGIQYPNITYKHLSREHEEGQCQQCLGSGRVEKISFTEHKEKIREYTPLHLFQLFFPESSSQPILHLLKTLGIPKNKKIKDLSSIEERKLFPDTTQDISLEKIFIDTLRHYPSCSLMHPLMSSQTCPSCQGWGIHAYAQEVRIHNVSLVQIYQEDTYFLRQFLSTIHDPSAQSLLQKLSACLSHIHKVGLDYITLSQEQHTLSDGEYYRLHLAKKISTNLTDIVYLLENPLSGLHPQDFPRLVSLLKELVSQHNTVIATDCGAESLPYADHTISLGPGSGPHGGYLSANQPIPTPLPSPQSFFKHATFPIDLSIYNIKNLHVDAPMHSIVAIAGVSGSGKTSLLVEGFYKQAQQLIATGRASHFSHVLLLDSHPISSLQRSDISTYFHIAPHLRNFYASLTQSKALNLSPSMFSTNTKQGQCSDCLGLGYHMIDRAFYALEKRVCPTCSGYRIQPLSQEVAYEGIHFGKLLQLPIEEVAKMFSFLKNVQIPLAALIQAGLGYLPLGQNLASLSLSEKISIKIAKNLYLPLKKPTLLLLDEITTSLDRDKKNCLYKTLRSLTSQGHSVIYVDHDSELLKHADFLIELGPGSGKHGGNVLFSGSPKDIETASSSILKAYLK